MEVSGFLEPVRVVEVEVRVILMVFLGLVRRKYGLINSSVSLVKGKFSRK